MLFTAAGVDLPLLDQLQRLLRADSKEKVLQYGEPIDDQEVALR